jgi:hypothetical protein
VAAASGGSVPKQPSRGEYPWQLVVLTQDDEQSGQRRRLGALTGDGEHGDVRTCKMYAAGGDDRVGDGRSWPRAAHGLPPTAPTGACGPLLQSTQQRGNMHDHPGLSALSCTFALYAHRLARVRDRGPRTVTFGGAASIVLQTNAN